MLALKSSLTHRGASNQATSCANTSITDLPPEILDLVLEHLYRASHDRIDSILPSSRVNRQLRASTLPLLFESVSCTVREQQGDGRHSSFECLLCQPRLLHHVKYLSLRKPVKISQSSRDNEEHRLRDVAILQTALQLMPQLQKVRLHCTLATAIDVLYFLGFRKGILIIADRICGSIGTLPRDTFLFTDLLRGRSAAVGKINVKFPAVVSNDSEETAQSLSKIKALDLGTDVPFPGHPRYRSPWITSALPDTLLELQELSFGRFGKTEHVVPWPAILNTVPWGQLRRLRIQGVLLERRLQDVIAKLRDLEDLCLEAVGPDTFHANCPFKRPIVHSDVNYPFFEMDFASVPKLRALEIVGICNHVPIRNLVGSGLRTLKLHKPDRRYSVMSEESQRSPSDLAMIAKLAPDLHRVELDVGYVENLWHPTAIPGVEVDMDQYRFLSVLSNFKGLRILRFFPPFVAKEDLHSDFRSHAALCQPLSDEQAVRMFNYLRTHCLKLEVLYLSVSEMTITSQMDFSPMNWEVRPWGDKTLVTTRQLGKDYELRQVWVGERRLTMETKKHAYWKRHIPDSENWLLSRSSLLQE